MLVHFKMIVREGENDATLVQRWLMICHDLPGIEPYAQLAGLGHWDGVFRVEDEAALEILRREGEVTDIERT